MDTNTSRGEVEFHQPCYDMHVVAENLLAQTTRSSHTAVSVFAADRSTPMHTVPVPSHRRRQRCYLSKLLRTGYELGFHILEQ